ncbi:MAG: carboxylating nicotinate-nucleotide diphosphorylase [Oryzomonas sp.]|uniref:carboxylating nicotinate-nucleotide diphosphorylase n=1 Tax=Oryzomonas sp. TaxID=2855186 RepID=UPI002844A7A6|nr:carboxylating nicotinate-nucleotide diphosphorylase [Oryzomonas sp.]MDR3579310.1 carboxylating nicotinate-nucleotide diphosphorylase [Oryzomonas sp.]
MLSLDNLIEQALLEDIHTGDITTQALIPADSQASARLIAKEELTLAGLFVAEKVFKRLNADVKFIPGLAEGALAVKGSLIATVRGSAAELLMGERVALNLLQRLSGIATLTSRYVAAVAGTGARIVDTRKTTPGLRELEKYAVRVGGGINHRTGLYDGILIKENHIAATGGIGEAIKRARDYIPHTLKIEIETETLAQVNEALESGADIIMLDNMSIADMRSAVLAIAGRALVEASGGVTLETVRAIAETGVDIISVGALTHSARAMDISMLLD